MNEKHNLQNEYFEIEETYDLEKLRAENYKKYRELYKNLLNLGRYHEKIDKDVLNEIRSSELYYAALKTGFFIEKYAESIKDLCIGTSSYKLLKKDIAEVQGDDPSKYKDLLHAVRTAYFRRAPLDPKLVRACVIHVLIVGTVMCLLLYIGSVTEIYLLMYLASIFFVLSFIPFVIWCIKNRHLFDY
ncbi:MAG: hypothetical protein J5515_04125 [Lachnospiraceae bacterium]|nr:hypothetical protein [Lachnospiraceae bacterium]